MNRFKRIEEGVVREGAILPGLDEAGLTAKVLPDHDLDLDPNLMRIRHLLVLIHVLPPGLAQSLQLKRLQKLQVAGVAQVVALPDLVLLHVHLSRVNCVEHSHVSCI